MNNSRIKILYLIDYFCSPGGGTENQLLELVTQIDRSKFDPYLAVFRPSTYLYNHSFPCLVKVLHINKLRSFKTLVKLLRLSCWIRQSHIDIVHILFNDAAIAAPIFCQLGGAKVISSRRDMGFWYNRTNLVFLKIANRFVNLITTNSHAVKENTSRQEGYPGRNIFVIHNGHDVEQFSIHAPPDFKKLHGIGFNDPIIGMVANLFPIKRHSDLIRAFKIVHEVYNNTHLVFAGEGGEEISLKKLSKALCLENNIHFLGSIPEIIPVVKHFTLCVLCSESEGLSNAIIEYMGCGKPIICTNCGGNPELIQDGFNGLLVEVGDVKGLADRMMDFLSDPLLRRRLGKNSQSKFLQDLSSEKMVGAYMHLYHNLLERNTL